MVHLSVILESPVIGREYKHLVKCFLRYRNK